ncbi:MAG: ABC transporter ATP-binding protein [Anaerolineae bacterium]|nr:ABC transporter ATP-binding protein [Anaerolineae bacterium]
MTDETIILEMKGIYKAFDQNQALDDVSFALRKREIHGLLGGNGAGKTTLMNILYGLYRMDRGSVLRGGREIDIRSPRDAIRHGIAMVHQHFLQVETYSVMENIVLGSDVKHPYTMNLAEERHKVSELAERFGLQVDLDAAVEGLTMGARQKVEILKSLYRGVDILILDEPTTNLTPQEVDTLFESLRVMVNEGLSIVFITHKLREVLSVCDRITVLRNGKNILTLGRGEASEEAFVRAMVGEEMNVEKSIFFSKGKLGEEALRVGETPVLEMENVHLTRSDGIALLKDITLTVYESEILGIAGVAGNGQRELAEVIMGVQPPSGGRIRVRGVAEGSASGDLLRQGVAYIPEDRLHDGFLPKANVATNLILGFHRQPPYSRGVFLDWNKVFETARGLIREYNIKTQSPADAGGNLSGGNIQRVMIARAFSRPAKLLVAHNPTRGLDIPSMEFVYQKLLEGKKGGMATLLLSEDLDELLLLCNRIVVLYRGEIVGVLPRSRFEKYEIGRMMSGVRTNV